jgi:hypothetical protein
MHAYIVGWRDVPAYGMQEGGACIMTIYMYILVFMKKACMHTWQAGETCMHMACKKAKLEVFKYLYQRETGPKLLLVASKVCVYVCMCMLSTYSTIKHGLALLCV